MRKNEKGVITVFLALVFGLLITFLVNLVNVTMVNSAKNQMIIASDAAITSTLAEYDRDLFKDYGLLAFQEDDEMIQELVNILQENLSGNEGLNSMFNYNVNSEDVLATTGGNPFEENDVMKKQMIYAMKYQGTENLALGIFDKINQFLNSKEVIKESEKLEEADKTIQSIQDEIEQMQNSKFIALKALVELAKNNNYDALGKGNIGYIDSIINIKDYYPRNESLEQAYNSIINYEPVVYLPKVYSYYYTKLVLSMYKQYLSTLNGEASEGEEDKETIDVADIERLIADLDGKINEEINAFNNDLNSYIDGINKGQKAVQTIIDKHDSSVKPMLDSYKESSENSQNEDIKKNAEESYKEYSELLGLENLNKVNSEFEDMLLKLNTTKTALSSIKSNYSNLTFKDWVNNNKNNSVFDEMNDVIGKDFKYPSDVNNFVKGICENRDFITCSQLQKISNIQLETINSESSYNAIKMDKPYDDGKYRAFYDLFKQLISEKDNIKQDIDEPKKASFEPVLSDDNNEQSKKISEQLEEIENSYNLGTLDSLINSGGEALDKLYLIEYIMTNFKDRSAEFENPKYGRIPELTGNSTTLNYEIESIISGKYNDEKSYKTLLDDFIAMRMTLNTITLMVYQDELKTFIKRVSEFISMATGGAIPIPLARTVIILGWAALETKYDIEDIFNGYSVPVIKSNFDEWVTNFGIGKNDFDSPESSMDMINKEYEPNKKDTNSYNKQGDSLALNYTDMTRLKLLITKADKIIDRSQNIIVENKGLQENYSSYKSDIEVNINKSKLNILFNTDVFSSKEGHSFNSFTLKKGYN